jgi:glutamate-1-semialdehyde 2,1-aminomutase
VTWQNRAELSIGQGALTNSKRPSTYIEGVYPTHASGGRGCNLYVGKRTFVDYVGALGTNLVGYGHAVIAEAIAKRFKEGATLSLSSETEVILAEKLKETVPWTDLWKFTKSGTEACNAAIKIARAYTGRSLVMSDGYHGHGDDFVSLTLPALGVPKRDWMCGISLERLGEAAAVILEPVILDYSRERKQYLIELKDACKKAGTLLIFDEIITGLRFPGFSVSKYFGIEPDMILLGKALGGGLPLSAIGGKKEVMNCGEYFISGTFFGETVSMQASLALLDLMKRDSTRYSIEELWRGGTLFLERFNDLHPDLKIVGYPSRGAFQGDPMVKALFWQEACRANILFGPSWFFNFPLMGETEGVIPVCKDILNRIKTGAVKLEGKMPAIPFAQTVREQNGR